MPGGLLVPPPPQLEFGEVAQHGAYTDSKGDNVAIAGRPGRFTTVSDPSAPPFSTLAAAINDQDVIAGSYLDASEEFHGFTDRAGTFTTVSDPAGTEGTAPQGISNTGEVVGFYVDSSGAFNGFALTPAR